MIGIYCITNNINNLKYVGQSRHIEQRFREHKNSSYLQNTAFSKALKEYGVDNFTFSILEECKIEELDEREIYWINKLNTYNKGYNMTFGGSAGFDYSLTRALSLEEVREGWKKGYSVCQIRDFYGRGSSIAIKNQLIELGYSKEEIEERGKQKRKIQSKNKKVNQYDKEWNLIQTYPSLNEAGRTLNISSQNIGKVCKQEREFCGGFRWRYVNANE